MVVKKKKVILADKEPTFVDAGTETGISEFLLHITDDKPIFVFNLEYLTSCHARLAPDMDKDLRFMFWKMFIKGRDVFENHPDDHEEYKKSLEPHVKAPGLDPTCFFSILEVDKFGKYIKINKPFIKTLSKTSHKKIIFTCNPKERAEKILELLGLKSAVDLCFFSAPNVENMLEQVKNKKT